VQVYAPTADSTDEEIEEFYEGLEKVLDDLPKKDIKIITGDWNAKVGSDNSGWEKVMGRYGYGDQNDRGERLLEFATRNNFFVCNTRFQQKESRKWTWMAPDGKHTNMIDLVLIDRRWKSSIRNCRTYQGADISSDHSLVLCKLLVRLRGSQVKTAPRPQNNTEALNRPDIRQAFADELGRRLDEQLGDEIKDLDERVSKLNTAIQEAMKATIPAEKKQHKDLGAYPRAGQDQETAKTKTTELRQPCSRVPEALQ